MEIEMRRSLSDTTNLGYGKSIGLWRWYINVTITILDIIHRPASYLKLNSNLQEYPYLTGTNYISAMSPTG
jgi:hypothetical protein